MSRVYEYGGNSMSSIDEYLDRVNKMHRAPTVIQDFPEGPSLYSNDEGVKIHKNHQYQPQYQYQYQSPRDQPRNKVRFTDEYEEVGKKEVCEEISVDEEADGFIQRRHKNFESCKTLKA